MKTELSPPERRYPLVPLEEPIVMHGRPVEDDEDEGLSIGEIVGSVRRHIWVVLAVTAVCLGIATYKALTAAPIYRADAVLRLSNQREKLAGPLGAGFTGGQMGQDPILSQIQVLRSRTVTGMVIDNEGLRVQVATEGFPHSALQNPVVDSAYSPDTPVSVALAFDENQVTARIGEQAASARYGAPLRLAGVGFTIAEHPGMEAAELKVLPTRAVIPIVLSSLETKTRDKTDIVDVAYTANDPVVAQRVVNAMINRFQDFNAGLAQQEARRRRQFIQEQLAVTDSVLQAAQLALTSFRNREKVYSSSLKFTSTQQGVLEMEMQRRQAQSDRQMFQNLLRGLEQPARQGEPDRLENLLASAPDLATNPAVAQQYRQLVEYEAKRDSLLTAGFAPSDRTIQQLETLTRNTRVKLMNGLRGHVESIEARLAALTDLTARNNEAISAFPAKEAEEVGLIRQVELTRAMADQLREEYQKAQISEAAEGGQVEIVDPAFPGNFVGSARIWTVVFGLIFGLIVGSGGAVVLENLNTTIRRRDEVEQVLQIPQLAIVPRTSGEAPSRLRLPIRSGNGNGKQSQLSSGESELVTATAMHTPAAEAFRTLRTNLIFSSSVGAVRSMVVTSSAPSEGKSTTASNLAVTFAQQGMKVLLVDCDLRKARLHKVFGVPREPGLTNLVLGIKTLDEVVRPTSIENLSFLASGTLPPNPSELVGGRGMRDTVEELAGGFDLVIFDTPPLLAATDAAILARITDGTLLVVRAGQTERDAAKQAVQQLQAVGVRVFGAVLNDPDSKVGQYGGYYKYEYYGAEE